MTKEKNEIKEKRICPDCKGTGVVDEDFYYRHLKGWENNTSEVRVTCRACKGKGWYKTQSFKSMIREFAVKFTSF